MPPAAFLLVVALGAPAPAGPDDPAVTVCELMARQGLYRPDSFARTAEPVVAANTVQITYSFRDAAGRAAAGTKSCSFRLAQDGRFHVEPFRSGYLARRLADAQARLHGENTPEEDMMVRSEMMDISREMFVEESRLRRAEHVAAAAGIYPIAPEATALAPEATALAAE
jgi:hypothetical protein